MHYILVYRYKNTYITIKVFIHIAPPHFETYTNMAKQASWLHDVKPLDFMEGFFLNSYSVCCVLSNESQI